MTKGSKWRVISNLRKVRNSSSLQQPRASEVVLSVTSKPGKPRGVEPIKVFREPFLQSRQIRRRESFGVREKGNALNNFREMHSLNNPFGAASLSGWNGLSVENARGHAGRRIEKPRSQMNHRLLGI